ncbi:FAS1 domain-containing protein [Rhexocercosporidium sp. MPI-PUGE-AT-0058]|nr:FAS1 domain-containing protein [Rhexocercosporidium sp. MPI-PUGE-AT-0058]
MKIPWVATLVPSSFAITLLQVLQTNPELSTLYSYVNGSANATSFLANSNNFTFLAPNNEAISALVKSQGNATLTGDLILASIQYGMLKGGFPTLSFSNESQFVSTNLANPSFANVTGGQAVELTVDGEGNPRVVSGNKAAAAVGDELICTGGIVHIIDKFLSIPIQAVLQISAARMQYFVSILNTAGYLNVQNAEYVDGIMRVPDVTYFIPNSAAALGNATLQAANSTAAEMKAVFQYHVVPGVIGYSSTLKDGMRLKTQEGSSLTITIQDGDIYVNSAKVIASDYIVANGVIHVIDEYVSCL